MRGSPQLKERRRAHSAGDCGGEKRRDSTLMKMSGSEHDLITFLFIFFYLPFSRTLSRLLLDNGSIFLG